MMANIEELTRRVADHLAGRPVKISWQNPPTIGAAGQVVKTPGGDLLVYVGELTGINTRFRVLLHELAHARFDYGWIPKSNDHRAPAASIKQTQEARQRWRSHWREQRATDQAAAWFDFAEKHRHNYFGRPVMEARLLALLDWRQG